MEYGAIETTITRTLPQDCLHTNYDLGSTAVISVQGLGSSHVRYELKLLWRKFLDYIDIILYSSLKS